MPTITRRTALALRRRRAAPPPSRLPAAAPAAPARPLKIGFVYVSPIGDAGWTYQHDLGRKQMEKALAGKVTTKYVESVPEGADAERVIRELAQSGHKLIFTTSFGYMNPTIKVAPSSFPKVMLRARDRLQDARRTSASTTRASTKAATSPASSPAR